MRHPLAQPADLVEADGHDHRDQSHESADVDRQAEVRELGDSLGGLQAEPVEEPAAHILERASHGGEGTRLSQRMTRRERHDDIIRRALADDRT